MDLGAAARGYSSRKKNTAEIGRGRVTFIIIILKLEYLVILDGWEGNKSNIVTGIFYLFI